MPDVDARRQALILLVEDNESDIDLIQRTFAKAGFFNPVKVVKTAEEAMAYLGNRSPYTDKQENPGPGLILLDLILPGIGGFEFLSWLRSRPEHEKVCVVVLTASTNLSYVRQAYQLGANSFLTKPLEIANVESISAVLRRPLERAYSR